ncbi:MAG TPA: hypothetical protein VMY76_00035 [Gemmatimonadales bacterium]|nr:hypothetical protein [Gemmatimonadales bacterium]
MSQNLPVAPIAPDTVGPTRTRQVEELSPRSTGELLRQSDLHLALDDVRRLRIVTAFQEMYPGLLRLAVGEGFSAGSSVTYNLRLLHRAYRKSIDYEAPGILELWRAGSKIGEYSSDGLLLGPEYSQLR